MVLAALGRVYYHQAELADARRVTEQAIAAAVGELGEQDHFVGRLRLHLSRVLRELTAFEEAEQLAVRYWSTCCSRTASGIRIQRRDRRPGAPCANPIPSQIEFSAFGNKSFSFSHSLENPAGNVRTDI
ncbi:hypothetical protein [Streptomyces sp. NBC_00390]|uniref:hypothetical protein n=1 Tax=Streptomyces sp. NBC_00390 TaxID=2975736 RepID=UPI003FCC3BA8